MILKGILKFEVVPGSMLEKGLLFAQNRQEELENVKFQINILTAQLPKEGELPKEIKSKLDTLMMAYNNLMYPHKQTERISFMEDSMAKFNKFKDLKFSTPAKNILGIDASKPFNLTIGK